MFTRSDSSGTLGLLTDGLGSAIALTDSSGAVQTQYTYEAFGKTTISGPGNANPSQFTARENDAIGLYYYRARYYDSGRGRFLSEDPIGFAADVNFYAYVGNNPVNSVDPGGYGSGLGVFRPLTRWYLKPWNHTFIMIEMDDGEKHTWGVLGDLGKRTNQRPYKDDFGATTPKDPRNDPKRAECKPVPGNIYHLSDRVPESGPGCCGGR